MSVRKVPVKVIDNALRSLGSQGTKCGDGDGSQDLAKRLLPLVSELDERKRMILVQRYGLDGKPPRTLQAIGTQLDRTRERIRQVQNAGLTQLQELLENA